jgi:Icc protein
MERREFLRSLGSGLAAGWAVSRRGWPGAVPAAAPPPRLALLADAHLKDGAERRPEARALARAVAEISSLNPLPDLVLFAGDLAHDGNAKALALGRDILSHLPAPLLPLMGEEDAAAAGAAAWLRLFGEPRFSRGYSGVHLLGLNTSLCTSRRGPVFEVGREQRRWLAGELARLDRDTALIVISHAPLGEIFRPWQQWTRDGQEVMRLWSGFSRVFCFHGHVHNGAGGCQLSAFPRKKENRKPETATHPLLATSWPLPSPLQGTPAAARPGLGPQGCGWVWVSLGNDSLQYQPQVWQV